MPNNFTKLISELKLEQTAQQHKMPDKGKLHEYGYGSIDFKKKRVAQLTNDIRAAAFELGSLYKHNKSNKEPILKIIKIVQGDFHDKLDELLALSKSISAPISKKLKISVPANLPGEIRGHVAADLRELEKAFNAGCFRASTILLGRILETCLHRIYYEATGLDILEKNPGIGLGKLIAKLAEKNVDFDPGLTQQIHLINQVRIHSVHVKKTSFYPSEQQTYAMILYTIDVIEKMF